MAFQAVCILVGVFVCSTYVKGSPQPQARVYLTFDELRETKTSEYFSLSQYPLDYRILLMDEDQDRMYVGSKDHILSLNINNISQEPLSVFWPASAIKVEECKMAGKRSHTWLRELCPCDSGFQPHAFVRLWERRFQPSLCLFEQREEIRGPSFHD